MILNFKASDNSLYAFKNNQIKQKTLIVSWKLILTFHWDAFGCTSFFTSHYKFCFVESFCYWFVPLVEFVIIYIAAMFVDAYCRKDIILLSAVPNISKENHYPKARAIHFEARIVECGKKRQGTKQ